jgi:hypothetical protein
MVRRWSSLRVFAAVLAAYLALCFVGVLLMASGGIGPDADPGVAGRIAGRIGSGMLGVLFLPLDAIHTRFFMGRPLPGNDWSWIVGVGSVVAALVALAHGVWGRAHRSPEGRDGNAAEPS